MAFFLVKQKKAAFIAFGGHGKPETMLYLLLKIGRVVGWIR